MKLRQLNGITYDVSNAKITVTTGMGYPDNGMVASMYDGVEVIIKGTGRQLIPNHINPHNIQRNFVQWLNHALKVYQTTDYEFIPTSIVKSEK